MIKKKYASGFVTLQKGQIYLVMTVSWVRLFLSNGGQLSFIDCCNASSTEVN